MYNRLQEKKDVTCSEEQVTIVQEIIQNEELYDNTFKMKLRDTIEQCH